MDIDGEVRAQQLAEPAPGAGLGVYDRQFAVHVNRQAVLGANP